MTRRPAAASAGRSASNIPAISNAIVDEKARAVEATGADALLAGDLGCLMNMAGKLHRRGARVRAFHTAEIVAGMGDGPAIGEQA